MCPKNNIQYLVLTGTVIMIYSKKYMLALDFTWPRVPKLLEFPVIKVTKVFLLTSISESP